MFISRKAIARRKRIQAVVPNYENLSFTQRRAHQMAERMRTDGRRRGPER
jgi:hypothetical protein